MGYYTTYNLTGDKIQEFVEDVARGEPDTTVYYWVDYAMDYQGPGTGTWIAREDVKWYDHETDIVDLSLNFPGVLFTLEGNGEEDDDEWTMFARDGVFYKEWVQKIYPVFDESKLP